MAGRKKTSKFPEPRSGALARNQLALTAPAKTTIDCPHPQWVNFRSASTPGPRLGFFGVVDERLDIDLVDALARAHPEWQIVMVGPIVKIDPDRLPRHQNLHWLGMQPYPLLPHLMAGWDVCLMPFALNESTHFISPTKTLEYFAGGKPVVSTAVPDVVSLHAAVARIAADHAEFIALCESALADDSASAARLRQAMDATVRGSSWDRAAERMKDLIEAVLETAAALRQAPFAVPAVQGSMRPVTALGRPGQHVKHTVIVAQATGLSGAHHVGQAASLKTLSQSRLEAQRVREVGWCSPTGCHARWQRVARRGASMVVPGEVGAEPSPTWALSAVAESVHVGHAKRRSRFRWWWVPWR